jgi:hypothetical protein
MSPAKACLPSHVEISESSNCPHAPLSSCPPRLSAIGATVAVEENAHVSLVPGLFVDDSDAFLLAGLGLQGAYIPSFKHPMTMISQFGLGQYQKGRRSFASGLRGIRLCAAGNVCLQYRGEGGASLPLCRFGY